MTISISMSSATLPVCTRMLTNLSHILAKAEQFVEAKKIDPTALTSYRLAPDMLPFTRQVLIACDAVKNGVALPRDMDVAHAKNDLAISANDPGLLVCGVPAAP